MSTDAQLTTTMNNNLPTNGTGDIDANEHRTVVAALIESKVSREDDATKLGLKELDATRSYVVGEGFILNVGESECAAIILKPLFSISAVPILNANKEVSFWQTKYFPPF